MFKFVPKNSNIRKVTMVEARKGAVVGVAITDGQDIEDEGAENLSLQLNVEYSSTQFIEIEMIKHETLKRALLVIQHEIDVCRERISTKK